jgi:hypothetical protein
MSNAPQNVLAWRTWRVVTTEDTLLTTYDASQFVSTSAIHPHPHTGVALRALGKASATNTATVSISGWMDGATARGPGQSLWKGTLTLGSLAVTGTIIPDGKWSGSWKEVTTWVDTVNACDATVASGGDQAMLILPTLAYSSLMLEIGDLDGAGEMTELGIMWRPVTMNGVF